MACWKDFVKQAARFERGGVVFEKGDTPWGVSKKIGIPAKDIMAANPGVAENRFVAGKWYALPRRAAMAPRTPTVVRKPDAGPDSAPAPVGRPAVRDARAAGGHIPTPDRIKYFFDHIKHGIDPKRYPIGIYKDVSLGVGDMDDWIAALHTYENGKSHISFNRKQYPKWSKDRIASEAAHEYPHVVQRIFGLPSKERTALLASAYPHTEKRLVEIFGKDKGDIEARKAKERESINSSYQEKITEDLKNRLGRGPSLSEFRGYIDKLPREVIRTILEKTMSGYEDPSKITDGQIEHVRKAWKNIKNIARGGAGRL